MQMIRRKLSHANHPRDGPSGLAGIAMKRTEKNVELIRPLLRRNKADILRYCEQWADLVTAKIAATANGPIYATSIRLDVLPYLSTFNPQLSQSLVRLAELASAEDDWMEQETRVALWTRYYARLPKDAILTRKALLGLHVALQRRLIKLILSYIGMETETISFDSVETIRLAAHDERGIDVELRCGRRDSVRS